MTRLASRRRATAIFGLMVGTLQFARAVPNATQAEQIPTSIVRDFCERSLAPSRYQSGLFLVQWF